MDEISDVKNIEEIEKLFQQLDNLLIREALRRDPLLFAKTLKIANAWPKPRGPYAMDILKKIVLLEISVLLLILMAVGGWLFGPMITADISHQIAVANNPFMRLREKEKKGILKSYPTASYSPTATSTTLYEIPIAKEDPKDSD